MITVGIDFMISFWFYAALFFACMLIMAGLTVRRLEKEIFKVKAKNIALQKIVDDEERRRSEVFRRAVAIKDLVNRRYGV